MADPSAVTAASQALWAATGGNNLRTTEKMLHVVIDAAEPWILVAEQRRIARQLRAHATRAEKAGQRDAAEALRATADRLSAEADGEQGEG